MLFDGCYIGRGQEGWDFLEALAVTFMTRKGGRVSAWTNLGTAVPTWLPLIGGRTSRSDGTMRTVTSSLMGLRLTRSTWGPKDPIVADAVD